MAGKIPPSSLVTEILRGEVSSLYFIGIKGIDVTTRETFQKRREKGKKVTINLGISLFICNLRNVAAEAA